MCPPVEDGTVPFYCHHLRLCRTSSNYVGHRRGPLLLLLLSATSAFCCDCIAPPLCQRIFSANVVVIGRVTDDGIDRIGARPGRDTQFVVEEILKGLPKGTQTMAVNPSRATDCWIHLKKGRRYLVIAHGAAGDLYTGACSGTDEIDKILPDLSEIRRLASIPQVIAAPLRSMEVRVKWWDGAPAEDAYVECTTEPNDSCVAPSTTAERTGAAGVATCMMPWDAPVFIAVSTLRGEPYVPRLFMFGEELFQDIFLDDIAYVKMPPSTIPTAVELVLTQANQSVRTAAIEARERRSHAK
jgi:hypothetical protein